MHFFPSPPRICAERKYLNAKPDPGDPSIQIIYFEHPHPKALIAKKCNVSLPPFHAALQQHCKCAARILIFCCWALQGYSAVGHWRDVFGWALQGYLVVGHCGDTLQLGTAGILSSWALQGYFVVGHCRDTSWLSTARILCGWAI